MSCVFLTGTDGWSFNCLFTAVVFIKCIYDSWRRVWSFKIQEKKNMCSVSPDPNRGLSTVPGSDYTASRVKHQHWSNHFLEKHQTKRDLKVSSIFDGAFRAWMSSAEAAWNELEKPIQTCSLFQYLVEAVLRYLYLVPDTERPDMDWWTNKLPLHWLEQKQKVCFLLNMSEKGVSWPFPPQNYYCNTITLYRFLFCVCYYPSHEHRSVVVQNNISKNIEDEGASDVFWLDLPRSTMNHFWL